MGQIIQAGFKQHRSDYPRYCQIRWLAALYRRCPAPEAWTYHVGFRVYETRKHFAVQFYTGIGGKGRASPPGFSVHAPHYRKSLDLLWDFIFRRLKDYGVDETQARSRVQDAGRQMIRSSGH